jgi:NTE family protein
MRKRIGLALAGGAAKGIAHIGVLKAMEELDLLPSYVAGTSAGALVGGLYASGMSPAEMEKVAVGLDRSEFSKLLDITWAKGSLVAGRRVEEFLHNLVGDVRIEELAIPFIATAVDINTGVGFHFVKGPLVDAIRASIAIPGVFEPLVANGGYLVDGGLRQNLPLTALERFRPGTLVAVGLMAQRRVSFDWNQEAEIRRSEQEKPKHDMDLWERLRERLRREEPEREELPGMAFIMSQVMNIYMAQGSAWEIEQGKPDLFINLDTSDLELWEFWRGAEAIRIGYEQSKPALEKLAKPWWRFW